MNTSRDFVKSHEAFVGQLVKFIHTPRGGYGFQIIIPAKIIQLSLDGSKAVIEFSNTKHNKTIKKFVKTESLINV